MLTRFCDRCHREIKDASIISIFKYNRIKIEFNYHPGIQVYDLCHACAKEVEQFITSKTKSKLKKEKQEGEN